MGISTRMIVLVCALVLIGQASAGNHHKHHSKKPAAAAKAALQPKAQLYTVNSSHTASLSSLDAIERQLEVDINELVGGSNFEGYNFEQFLPDTGRYIHPPSYYAKMRELEEEEPSYLAVMDFGSSGTKMKWFSNTHGCSHVDGSGGEMFSEFKQGPNVAGAQWARNGGQYWNHFDTSMANFPATAARAANVWDFKGHPSPAVVVASTGAVEANLGSVEGFVGGATAGNRIILAAEDDTGWQRVMDDALSKHMSFADNTSPLKLQVATRLGKDFPATLPGTEEAWWEYKESLRQRSIPVVGVALIRSGNFISVGGASAQMGIEVHTEELLAAVKTFRTNALVTDHAIPGLNGASHLDHFVCVCPVGTCKDSYSCRRDDDPVMLHDLLLISWLTAGPTKQGPLDDATAGKFGQTHPGDPRYFSNNIGGTDQTLEMIEAHTGPGGGDSENRGINIPANPSAPPTWLDACVPDDTRSIYDGGAHSCYLTILNYARSNNLVAALTQGGDNSVMALSKVGGDEPRWMLYGNQMTADHFRNTRAKDCDGWIQAVAVTKKGRTTKGIYSGAKWFCTWTEAFVSSFGLNGHVLQRDRVPVIPLPNPNPPISDGVRGDFFQNSNFQFSDWGKALAYANGHPEPCTSIFGPLRGGPFCKPDSDAGFPIAAAGPFIAGCKDAK